MSKLEPRLSRLGGSSWKAKIDPEMFQEGTQNVLKNIELQEARRMATRITKRDNKRSWPSLIHHMSGPEAPWGGHLIKDKGTI